MKQIQIKQKPHVAKSACKKSCLTFLYRTLEFQPILNSFSTQKGLLYSHLYCVLDNFDAVIRRNYDKNANKMGCCKRSLYTHFLVCMCCSFCCTLRIIFIFLAKPDLSSLKINIGVIKNITRNWMKRNCIGVD